MEENGDSGLSLHGILSVIKGELDKYVSPSWYDIARLITYISGATEQAEIPEAYQKTFATKETLEQFNTRRALLTANMVSTFLGDGPMSMLQGVVSKEILLSPDVASLDMSVRDEKWIDLWHNIISRCHTAELDALWKTLSASHCHPPIEAPRPKEPQQADDAADAPTDDEATTKLTDILATVVGDGDDDAEPPSPEKIYIFMKELEAFIFSQCFEAPSHDSRPSLIVRMFSL